MDLAIQDSLWNSNNDTMVTQNLDITPPTTLSQQGWSESPKCNRTQFSHTNPSRAASVSNMANTNIA